jgi:hypothetical protein
VIKSEIMARVYSEVLDKIFVPFLVPKAMEVASV